MINDLSCEEKTENKSFRREKTELLCFIIFFFDFCDVPKTAAL